MIVGMDFGTTNSGMAVYDGQQLQLIPLDPSSSNAAVTPTALYITNDREVFIGREAIDQYYQHNLNRPSKMERVRVGEIELTFAELPTFIRDVYIEKDIYSPGRLFLSFKMGLANPDYLGTLVGTDYFYLEDIIATYLYTTRKRAESHLGQSLKTIVLGRPVRYNDDPAKDAYARERMIQAAFRAGYETVYLQYEPIAAAHYYETTLTRPQNVLIFDFGGGTLDISVLRLGAGERQVLANGGIPIAGNVFDQRIVRAKMPPHFGEGEQYRTGERWLPIPSHFYEGFTNWQDLLLLQMPVHLETLRKIERFAEHPLKIRAFINMITGHYALRMFDMAEQVKIRLSNEAQSSIVFEGKNFFIHDTINRAEFERVIRADIRAIEERLESVIAAAGLGYDKIDAVIRTGGSSRIPVFIEMLESRFGADKVRELDAFSSVTSGLGIIGQQIEQGDVPLRAYHAADYNTAMHQKRKDESFPLVNLDLMKRLIDVKEDRTQTPIAVQPVVIVRTAEGTIAATEYPATDQSVALHTPAVSLATLLNSEEQALLMTTEYRLLTKSVRQLAEFTAAGIHVEALEDFTGNAFGREMVCAIASAKNLHHAALVGFFTTLGYLRIMDGEKFLPRLGQSVATPLPKSRGYPAALVNVLPDGDLLAFTEAGRAVKMKVKNLSRLEERFVSMPLKQRLLTALSVNQPCELLVASGNGYAQRLNTATIPYAESLNTTGVKIISRSNLAAVTILQPQCSLIAITNQRFIPIPTEAIPADDAPVKLLKLKNEEVLIQLTQL